jgi:hypothetical protein
MVVRVHVGGRMAKKINIGSDIRICLPDGMISRGIVMRIGEASGSWRMVTLDVDGSVAYLAMHENELEVYPGSRAAVG